MAPSFKSFVIFAEMRTGSNFLESNLNMLETVTCFGEAFNPHFIGYPNQETLLGVSQDERDKNPRSLLQRVQDVDGLGGFRYFHDHDPRVFEAILDDPDCAKIILTRNLLDSYISLKIARQTGQWKLTNVKRRKDAQVDFVKEEFMAHIDELQAFQLKLTQGLQVRGQVPFFIAYEDLQNLDVMNGLLAWLGQEHRLEALDEKLKRQNPAPAVSKVSNPEEMAIGLSEVDAFNLSRTPCFEPRRGPNVRSYIAAAQSPLLFLPIMAGPVDSICKWMAALDGVEGEALKAITGQKHLRQWMSERPGYRSFAVLRHPLLRAHTAFCEVLRNCDTHLFKKVRHQLERQFQVELPKTLDDSGAHYAAFSGFLEFLQQNLNGQSALRVDASWASQSQILSGFEEFCAPDHLLREDELLQDLTYLARKLGKDHVPALGDGYDGHLGRIYDTQLEQKARAVYRRDYMLFGFGDWRQRG